MAEQTNANRPESQVPPTDREKGKAGKDPENSTKTPEEVETDVEIEDRFEATDN